MAAYKVEICGVNTAKLPILKESEKEELFAKIKQGDMAARETYIKGNLRLVLSVIKRFSNHNENVDDLFQIGCIGLIKSIDNFNPDMGVKFSTYAVPMIIGEIRRYLRDNNSIRVSRSLRDTAYKAIHAKEILTRTASTEPTLEDIAKETGIINDIFENRIFSNNEEVRIKLSTLSIDLIRHAQRPRLTRRISQPANIVLTFLFFNQNSLFPAI